MPKQSGLVVVRASFFAGNRLVRAGDVWASDDPVVRHYPAAFKELVVQQSASGEAPASPAPPARPQQRLSLSRAKS